MFGSAKSDFTHSVLHSVQRRVLLRDPSWPAGHMTTKYRPWSIHGTKQISKSQCKFFESGKHLPFVLQVVPFCVLCFSLYSGCIVSPVSWTPVGYQLLLCQRVVWPWIPLYYMVITSLTTSALCNTDLSNIVWKALESVHLWREKQERFSRHKLNIVKKKKKKSSWIYTSLPPEGAVMQVCNYRTSCANQSQTRPTGQILLMRVNLRIPFALKSLTLHLPSRWLIFFLPLTSGQFVCFLKSLHSFWAHVEIS